MRTRTFQERIIESHAIIRDVGERMLTFEGFWTILHGVTQAMIFGNFYALCEDQFTEKDRI